MSTALWPEIDESLVPATMFDESAATAGAPHVEYRRDPIGWAVAKLGIPRHTLEWSLNAGYGTRRWDGTRDPLVAVAQGLVDWKDVGIESATGTGKSFFAAVLILWFLACWRGARVFTFAPKEEQLRLYIWMEIGKLWPRFREHFPAAQLLDLELRMDGTKEWAAFGYSVGVRAGEEVATKAAGMHAEHMLLVNEETPGIPHPVMAAQENTCTAPHNLRLSLGNPDNQHDALHVFCTSPGVVHVTISALDHPNIVCRDATIIPGATSVKSVKRRLLKYGRGSAIFESRVRGISPAQSVDALIKLTWCVLAAAKRNDPLLRRGPKALGVDVANSENGDKGAIARGIGFVLLEVEAFPCPDANELGRRVHREMIADKHKPVDQFNVGVDSVGVGAGTVNELRRLGQLVQSLNGGETAEQVDEEKFVNLRSQMWWQLREDLRNGEIALPADEELYRDLTTPKWDTTGGRIRVEAKDDLKKRLGRSPDKGDAAVYWNWVRARRLDPDEIVTDPDNTSPRFEKLLRKRKRAAAMAPDRDVPGRSDDDGFGPRMTMPRDLVELD